MARYAEHEGDEIDPSAAFSADLQRPAEIGLAPRVLGSAKSNGGVSGAEMTALSAPLLKKDAMATVEPAGELVAQERPRGAMERLVSMDAFRGLVMVMMVSAGLRLGDVIKNMQGVEAVRTWASLSSWDFAGAVANTKAGMAPASWRAVAEQTDHVAWRGAALWDFIQPSFMFMVGTAMAFSLASRRAKGQSFGWMIFHAIWRSAVLVLLAVFMGSNGTRTNWQFTNVLAQIGLGYTFLFLVAWLKPRWQLVSAVVILAGYWALFAFSAKPAEGFDWKSRGVAADWKKLEGFGVHWEKNANAAAEFDRRFLNWFPQVPTKKEPAGKAFDYNPGGYATLNFVPSLATMIFGLLAGEWLRCRDRGAGKKFGGLMVAGAVAIGVGWGLDYMGWCPLIKRIWTPSWAVLSAGVALAALGVFYLVVDIARFRIWAVPLIVVGMNSIAMYYMFQMFQPFVRDNVKRHFGGEDVFDHWSVSLTGSKVFAPAVNAVVFLLLSWAAIWWMYRRKIFIRI